MRFEIEFDARALKEWKKLDGAIREQFRKKLKKLQESPRNEANKLHGELKDCYKIKLRTSGFRLIYQVIDQEIIIFVIAIGKREKAEAYSDAEKRLLS